MDWESPVPREGVGAQKHPSAELKREGDPLSCPGPQRGLRAWGPAGREAVSAPPLSPPSSHPLRMFAFQGGLGQRRGSAGWGAPAGRGGSFAFIITSLPFKGKLCPESGRWRAKPAGRT